MSFVAWVENACEAQVNREERYRKATQARAKDTAVAFASGWPKAYDCPVCHAAHDPLDGSHSEIEIDRATLLGEWLPAYRAAGGRFPDDAE